MFATPYFAYDIYAMFLCHRYKLQVKGHQDGGVRAVAGFLRREALMVLHHVFVVAFCFPASVVTMATQLKRSEGATKTALGLHNRNFLLEQAQEVTL